MATKTKSTTKNRIADLNGDGGHEESTDEVSASSVMRLEIVTFKIIGLTPLLQNNPVNFIGVTEGSGLGGKKKYDDAEEAKLRLYVASDGAYYHPCAAFIKAMLGAATGKKFGKVFATSVIKRGVFLVDPIARILDENGKPAKKYGIDKRPAVVGTARVPRVRPFWMPWRMQIAIEIDAAILSRDQVLEVMNLSGKQFGVGDLRNECGGMGEFGVYRVE